MIKLIKSLFSPLRIKIPFLFDVIIVSDPEHIKKIETSGDVDRLHAYGTASVPLWLKIFFRATRFHDYERDLWFLSLESASNPDVERRRAYLEAAVVKGYSESDVNNIAGLLNTNADDEALEHGIAQIVNRRFFGEEIPLPITKAAKHTLQNFREAVLPWKYLRARKSQKEIMRYCDRTLGEDVHLVDVGHNIGEVVQTTAGALRTLKDNLEKPVDDIFTLHALTPQVPRIAVKSSRLDGLLLFPTVEGKTVFIFQIGKAAAKTKDILFTFGTGSPERACVFKGFFLEFMNDLQKVLRAGTPPSSTQA